ncbi:MAG: hypothetical protein ACOCTI_01355 [Phycisphaeraceae bacterium]
MTQDPDSKTGRSADEQLADAKERLLAFTRDLAPPLTLARRHPGVLAGAALAAGLLVALLPGLRKRAIQILSLGVKRAAKELAPGMAPERG